jgi:hypothetical protein
MLQSKGYSVAEYTDLEGIAGLEVDIGLRLGTHYVLVAHIH